MIIVAASIAAVIAARHPTQASTGDIHKIRHVIIIMQENRSFDQYFGTFPGADGIPMTDGIPVVCVNDPKAGRCIMMLIMAGPTRQQTLYAILTAARWMDLLRVFREFGGKGEMWEG